MEPLDVTRTLYRVSDFLSWQRARTLVLSPSFQRRAVWNKGAKSYLVDTIFRGLPIPILFLRDQRSDLNSFEPRREVVDGQQRIRTLISYIDPSALEDYTVGRDDFCVQPLHNPLIANQSFDQLSPDFQHRILDYQFSVHVLSSGVDDREVLSIFARMNSTGVKLNPQELRNAGFFGEFKTSMYETAAAHLQRWREWGVFSEDDIARMLEVELSSEFALLMLNGLTGKRQPALDSTYKEKDETFPERKEVERRFNVVMDTIDDKLSNRIKSLPFSRKTLFYSLFAYLYDYQFGIGSPLEHMRPKMVPNQVVSSINAVGEGIIKKTAPEGVLQSVTRRTTNPQERSIIHNYLKEVAGSG
ncbi:MAG: DUF262 domain-containing protein [Chloroflexi bacterium]|nr:DUF262 domain-containing protein [Chloroflexota bacterium]